MRPHARAESNLDSGRAKEHAVPTLPGAFLPRCAHRLCPGVHGRETMTYSSVKVLREHDLSVLVDDLSLLLDCLSPPLSYHVEEQRLRTNYH